MHGGILAGPGPLVPPPLGPRPRHMTPTPIRRSNPVAVGQASSPPVARSGLQKEAPPIGTGFAPGSDVTIHKKQVKLTHPNNDNSSVVFETIETDEKRHS